MKILVTGGSGYLGTHVCHFFNADDFSRRTGHDILDEEDVKMVADYDAVIHLAAHLDKDPQAAELCFRTNAEGALNVVGKLISAKGLISGEKDLVVAQDIKVHDMRPDIHKSHVLVAAIRRKRRRYRGPR